MCKRQCMSKNSNTSLLHQHLWINFWYLVLFTYWKVIKFPWESFHVQFRMWGHFLVWTKKKHCFSWKLHIAMVWFFFFDKHLFIRPENSKASLKIESQTFLRQKLSTFVVSKWYTQLLTFDYPLQYVKRPSIIIAR